MRLAENIALNYEPILSERLFSRACVLAKDRICPEPLESEGQIQRLCDRMLRGPVDCAEATEIDALETRAPDCAADAGGVGHADECDRMRISAQADHPYRSKPTTCCMFGRVETRVGPVRNSTESPVSPLNVSNAAAARACGGTADADALSAICHKVLARAAPPDYVPYNTPPGWRNGETRGT